MIPRMEQLIGFVEVERVNSPDRTHIAEWALAEIERLHAALLKIATTKGFGPDGPSLESWKHWADQAQDALTPNV